jgi:hypothetical protein
MELCSEEWFARARAAADALPRRDGLSCRLQYEASTADGSRRWVQVVEDGRVTRWEAGELEDPDLELHWRGEDAFAILTGRLGGTDALARTKVLEPGSADPALPSPMDLADQPELAEMPRLPGADLVTQYRYPRGPFGTVLYVIEFVDGQVDTMWLGEASEPDAMVQVTYRNMALVRRGDIGIYDAIEGGRVDGDIGALGLLAGLSETPAFHRAELACGSSGMVLSALGEATAVPEFGSAMSALATETEPLAS